MIELTKQSWFVAIVILTVAWGGALGGEKKSADKAEWKSLLDGKSLKGWKSTNFGGEGDVEVQNGAVIMDQGNDMTGITYTGTDFPRMDYEVTLEGKKIKGNDFFCTTTFPVGNAYCSLVVGGWGGTVVGLSNLNDRDASENETGTGKEFKKDQWYRVRIRVSKDRIQVSIDQEKLIDADTQDKKITIRGECEASKPFGIATWRTTGAVRDIRVRLLTAAEKANPALNTSVGEPSANRQVDLKKGDRILFFGDSLTYLAGNVEATKGRATKGYLRIVQESLDKTHPDLGVKVDWVATGGHTVPDLLKRLDKDVLPKKPTIVVIQIGCNDARRLPKEKFKASLEELIDRLQKEKIQVVQCTLTSVGEKYDGTNKDDPKLEEFAEIQRQVIKAKNLPYNDLRKAFVAYWKMHNPDNKANGILTYDGNHWNDTGMRFVAEQMLNRFK